MKLSRALEDVLNSFGDDENGERASHTNAGTRMMLPPPSEPMAVARVFIGRCLHDNLLTLRHWRAGWWMWRTTHWVEVDDRAVRSILYRFTEHALYREGKNSKEWAPTRRKIGDLTDALSAICVLPNDLDQPGWLDDAATEDGVIVSVKNGLLDVEQQRLSPHTPQFFNQTSVRSTTIRRHPSRGAGWNFLGSYGRRSRPRSTF